MWFFQNFKEVWTLMLISIRAFCIYPALLINLDSKNSQTFFKYKQGIFSCKLDAFYCIRWINIKKLTKRFTRELIFGSDQKIESVYKESRDTIVSYILNIRLVTAESIPDYSLKTYVNIGILYFKIDLIYTIYYILNKKYQMKKIAFCRSLDMKLSNEVWQSPKILIFLTFQYENNIFYDPNYTHDAFAYARIEKKFNNYFKIYPISWKIAPEPYVDVSEMT